MRGLIITSIVAMSLFALSANVEAQEAPAAPEILSFNGETLTWADNSDDEAGFRIVVENSSGEVETTEFVYEVAADVTDFAVPSEARLDCMTSLAGSITTQVVAFNEAGESASTSLVSICPAVDFQGGPEDLPNSGTGPAHDGDLPWLVVGLAGAALVAGGTALRLRSA